MENQVFYEGYVRLCDEGYFKTLYVNVFIPHHQDNTPFYLSESKGEAWPFILVKALAKFFGSYDNLRQAGLKALSTALFGCVPFALNQESRLFFDQECPQAFHSSETAADHHRCLS